MKSTPPLPRNRSKTASVARTLLWRNACVIIALGIGLSSSPSLRAADGTWNLDGNGTWGNSSNWLGGTIADGAGSTGNFSALNITSNVFITVDTTSRTLGTMTIGDTVGSQQQTFNATGGASLTMNNSGSGALISRTAAGVTTIAVPLILADHLTIRKAGTNAMNVTGGITSTGGTRNLFLQNNSGAGLSFTTAALNHSGSITNTGNGSGTVSLNSNIGANVTGITQNSSTSSLSIGGTNNSTGGINVLNGTISVDVATGASASNLVTMSANGTFQFAPAAGLTIAGLDGAGGNVRGGAASASRSLTLGGNGTYSYAGLISDNNTAGGGISSIVKSGNGTQTLSGNNTYTGATQVTAGTLIINGNQVAATGNVTVSSGATLGGNGTLGGNTVINGNLTPGNSPGLLTFNGSLTLNSTAVTTMEIGLDTTRGTTFDAVNVGTALAYGGNMTLNMTAVYATNQTWNLFDFSSQSGNFTGVALTNNYSAAFSRNSTLWSATTNSGDYLWEFQQTNGVLSLTIIPEPSTWALLAASLTTLVIFRRRRSTGSVRSV